MAQTPQADSFNPGADAAICSIGVQADGKILVGGVFWTLGGEYRGSLGRLHADGSLDTSFNPGGYPAVYSLAVQPDGKILVGGDFWSLGGRSCENLGRLHADGSLDTSFYSWVDGVVHCLAIQPDGKIVVGGSFTSLGWETVRNNIGRINANASLDTSFYPWAGDAVYCLAVQPDGKILVGGKFTDLGGQPRSHIGRLNKDGSMDTGFNPEANEDVYCVTVQPDGKMLVGGNFTTLGGHPREHIGRLNADGSLDSNFNPGASAEVCSVTLQADGRILVGGRFRNLGGQPCNYLGRLNPDGSLDTSFSPGADGVVGCLALQSDGKILAGGEFTSLGGQARNYIGRLNNTGPATQSFSYEGSTVTWWRGGTSPGVWRTTLDLSTNGLHWTSRGAGTYTGPGAYQWTGISLGPRVTLRTRGWAVGGFHSASGWYLEQMSGPPAISSPPENLLRTAGATATFSVIAGGTEPLRYQWRKNGIALADGENVSGASTPTLTLSNVFKPDQGGYTLVLSNSYGSLASAVTTLTVVDPFIVTQPLSQNRHAGESVSFDVSAVGTLPINYQWLKDGTPLVQATNKSLFLTNLQGLDAGRYSVVVGNQHGNVTSSVALLAVNLATLDTNFNPGVDWWITCLAVQLDGKILAGGSFRSLGGQPRNYIGRLNADGSLDSNFNPGASDSVCCLAVQPDGKILVGGSFTTLGGQPRNYLGRLDADGSVDTGFNPGVDSWIVSMAIQADGKILVGGGFTLLGGYPRNNLGRFNPDGSIDTSFNPGANSEISSIVVQANGKILVGGSFSTLGGYLCDKIGRLNEDGSVDTSFNAPPANYSLGSLTVQADGKILVAGYMWTSTECNYLGRLNPDGSLDTSFSTELDSSIHCLTVQTDGKILVGGYFTTLCREPRNHIGRLNADGSVDSSFNPGADSAVTSLAVQADGMILVGGGFTNLAGQSRHHLGRLNNSGLATQSLSCANSTISWQRQGPGPQVGRATLDFSINGLDWSSLGAGTYTSTGGYQWTGHSLASNVTWRARGCVSHRASSWLIEQIVGPPAISVPPASLLRTAGATATFSVRVGGPEPYSYQWYKNGMALVDGGEVSGTTTPSLTLRHVLKPDQGSYTLVLGSPYRSVTSTVATLTVVDPFLVTVPLSQEKNEGESVTFDVSSIGTQPLTYQWWKDGTSLARATNSSLRLTDLQGADAGSYSVVVCNQYGKMTSSVAVLTVNLATPDTNFTPGAGWSVQCLAVQPDGKILAGGRFTSLGGEIRTYIGRLNADGSLDSPFNPGASYDVVCLAVQADGKILVGGQFLSLAGQPRNYVGRLNADGSLDSPFNPDANGAIHCIVVQADGKSVVGGEFSTLGGQPRNYIGRLNTDGSLDGSFAPSASADNYVSCLAVQPDGKVVVGGCFTTLGGYSRSYIGRLNTDGILDTSFSPGTDGYVNCLALQPDGKILIAGNFSYLAGQPRPGLGRLNPDGSLDFSFIPAIIGGICTVALQADGKILLGGNFWSLGGQLRNHIGRLNADGGLDTSFNPAATGNVYCLAVQADGKLLAGGDFWVIGGQPCRYLGRLNNTGPATQSLNYDGSIITWQRGGTSPGVARATLEFSTNGVNWTSLGASRYTSAGAFQWTGVSLASNTLMRAQGWVVGGLNNSSSWLVEKVSRYPQTLPSLGLQSIEGPVSRYKLIGATHLQYFVQTSTNLPASFGWAPVCELALTNGWDVFSWTNQGEAQRFFRAVEK